MNQPVELPCRCCGKIITISNKNRYCVKCSTTDIIGPMQFVLEDVDFKEFVPPYRKKLTNNRIHYTKK